MPFSKPLSYPSPYFWATQIFGSAHCACNKLVKETVFEPSVEGRCEAMAGQEAVGARLLCPYVSIGRVPAILHTYSRDQ
jgi:hypothetical protein